MADDYTVSDFLIARLEELGLTHIFGVAGNYTAGFLDTIAARQLQSIALVGTTNEIVAGYSADAYARLRGFGAAFVTFGVGPATAMVAFSGAFVEHVPILLINGAPTLQEHQRKANLGTLFSHMTGFDQSDINAYRPITVAAEQIRSNSQAPYQIDTVLSACIQHSRPAYLEVFEDVWRAPCARPAEPLVTKKAANIKTATKEAVAAIKTMIERTRKPIFWAGSEIARYRLQEDFQDLVEATRIPFTTSILGKSVLAETHPCFRGVFDGSSSSQEVYDIFTKAGCRIALGVLPTSKNLGGYNPHGANMAMAVNGSVQIESTLHANVPLAELIPALREALAPVSADGRIAQYQPEPIKGLSLWQKDQGGLTFDSFFSEIDRFLKAADPGDYTVISDASMPLFGSQDLTIKQQDGFIAQAGWLAIGYACPAALGAKCANAASRVLVFTGDGSFHETCQAISDHHHQGHNTVVFVIDNGIYGLEQMLVNPNPFRDPQRHYEDPLLNAIYPYNRLARWHFAKITEVMGGCGYEVATVAELREVLSEIEDSQESNVVVHVRVPETDYPQAVAGKVTQDAVGEDETEHPGWPPF